MRHAVKTHLGSYRIIDGEGSHIVMTREEFHENVEVSRMLRDDIRHLSRESIDLHRKLQDDLKTIESLKSELAVAEGTIKELSEQKDDLERSISSLKDELAKLKDDLAHAESLNINLKRICRERANQARGLSKNEDGYTILYSREHCERSQCGKLIRSFKSEISTPYDAGMDAATAKRQIFEDLVNGVLADLGCPYYEKVNGRPAEPIEEMSMYRWIYTADYRSGFWTVTIYTTGPLTVPPHRRPQQKRNRRGTQDGKSEFRSNAEESTEKGS